MMPQTVPPAMAERRVGVHEGRVEQGRGIAIRQARR
jgi:hypothetical protein